MLGRHMHQEGERKATSFLLFRFFLSGHGHW